MAKKEAVTNMGIEIVDKCPCGKKVGSGDRQELVMHSDKKHPKKRWYRMCGECLKKDKAVGPLRPKGDRAA